VIDELQRQRAHFRMATARILRTAPEAITVSHVLDRLPAQDRSVLLNELTRIRQMADELAANNRRVSIFARVHLDAYQRILRDLTNSHRGSGRYGSTGNAETPEYRPLIQVQG
jgi:flagellar biosynthesis/type III secretory pathway chaperone